MIYELLNQNEKKCIEIKGRFRDINTREIYKYNENIILKTYKDIVDKCKIRFESERAPNVPIY